MWSGLKFAQDTEGDELGRIFVVVLQVTEFLGLKPGGCKPCLIETRY